jgi:enoyl-CoA hydratase/carnithine racemase
MTGDNVIIEKRGGVGSIILDRPPLNILTIDMCRAVTAAIESMDQDSETKVIVLTSAGDRAFAAGADMGEHSREKVHELMQVIGDLCRILQRPQGKPRIAAVKGVCSGGGNEVAAHCDLVVAREDARFSQPEVKIGGMGNVGCMMMARKMPRAKVFEMGYTGDWMDVHQAHTLGYVTQVFSRESYQHELEQYLQNYTDKSMVVLKNGREQLCNSFDVPHAQAFEQLEQYFIDTVWETEDYLEGVNAFLQKRKPVWKNR